MDFKKKELINATDDTNNEKKKKDAVRRILLIIIAILLLLLGFLVFAPKPANESGNVTLTTGEDITNEDNPLKDLYVTYAGITDATITEDTVVQLENLEENGDIIMMFKIYEDGELIHSTDYIESGKYLSWEAGKELSVGEHELQLVQIPKIMVNDEYVPLTSGTCEFVLTKME